MGYLLISFSHKNSNIVDRDSISFKDNSRLEIFMSHAMAYLSEIMIVNTCNRIEFFAYINNDDHKAIDNLLHDISHSSHIEFSRLNEMANIYQNERAIHHLFAVVSSLQSLVIGETQIVGQVKDAFRFAFENGFAHQNISRAVHYAFKCSAQVRSETGISQKKVSIASVAVSRAVELIGSDSISGLDSVVIGAGEMSRLLVQYLASRGSRVTIINRTKSKAQNIAHEVNSNSNNLNAVHVAEFEELANLINRASILFTATSSENPIILKNMVEYRDFERWWFDLAVPKDIDNIELNNLHVYRVDDLRESVEINKHEREESIGKAYRIIGETTMKFLKWIDSLDIEPLMKNIYLKAKQIAIDEVEKSIEKGFIPVELKINAEKLAESSIKKMLHGVSKNLKNISKDSSSDMVIESINYLFNFKKRDEQKTEVRNHYKCDYAVQHRERIV